MPGKGGKQNPSDQGQRRGCRRSCHFGLPVSPVKYLKHVGVKVAAAVVRVASGAAAAQKPRRSNPAPPPKTSVAPIDSQRAEAIDDCIDFINSSSSLPRSNSVAP